MSIKFTITCDGCSEQASSTGLFRRRFHGSNGDWGFGSARWPDPQTLAPEGWMLSDPWTYCTYCPECWANVNADQEPEAASA